MTLLKAVQVAGIGLFFSLAACNADEPAPQDSARDAARDAAETAQDTKKADDKTVVDGFEELAWEDLMPEGEEERLMEMYAQQQQSLYSRGGVAEGSAADKAIQLGTFNVVDALNDQKVRLPGYTVPFEYGPNAEIREFLLVPYFGACLHAPPPPPNQTVYVISETPIKIGDLAQAVWVQGTLKTQTQNSELADTAYTLILDEMEEYQY